MITKEKVEEVISKIRAGLRADGGDIEMIELKDDVVRVKLKGACGACPMAALTLKNFVEASLKREMPGIKSVQSV